MSFSIHSFCLTFTELDKSFDDDDQHVGKSWNTQKQDALEAIQSIMELLDKDIDRINERRQQQWAFRSSVQQIVSDTNHNDTCIGDDSA